MTSTIKVNTIQNTCGADIIKESSNTITIGASGDTVTLASGASQTGFGRTGTVDWDTTAKTAPFTAVSGNGYFVNTTSGSITVTLPASPSAGDIVAVSDYASIAQTNNIIIAPNGSDKINGVNASYYIQTQGLAVTLVYVDATKGWKSVTGSDADATGVVPTFITATGGTITTSGDYKIHTFTGPSTFTVCSVGNAAGSNSVDYLVVAGGGSGGGEINNGYGAGAGGAGGYRESSGTASGSYTASPLGACVSALPVTAIGYPITVGGGGAQINAPSAGTGGNQGSNSIFSSITSTGGGGGGAGPAPAAPGGNGGSGGGAHGSGGTPFIGSGNTPPVSPPQGNPGGIGVNSPYAAGGGGGATQAGQSGSTSPQVGGTGGAGATSSINGTPTTRAGGGGGGVYRTGPAGDSGVGGTGGAGGGGPGGPGTTHAVAGTTNTGGGGGGASSGFNPCFSTNSGGGGSGIVIIRYKFQ